MNIKRFLLTRKRIQPLREFKRPEIPDIVLVEYIRFLDQRGFFAKLYKRTDFLANKISHNFIQGNLSFSKRNVVRGLHYQLRPMEQGKLVFVVSGRVYDVAVDIRRGSPWFGRFVGVYILSLATHYGYHQASPTASKLSKTHTSYTQ